MRYRYAYIIHSATKVSGNMSNLLWRGKFIYSYIILYIFLFSDNRRKEVITIVDFFNLLVWNLTIIICS